MNLGHSCLARDSVQIMRVVLYAGTFQWTGGFSRIDKTASSAFFIKQNDHRNELSQISLKLHALTIEMQSRLWF